MLSYLHGFHAGNFADVHKHTAFLLCLQMMQEKDSGIALFDTHAGSGLYDLNSEQARKTAEADTGVQAVWAVRDTLGASWEPWLGVLEEPDPGADRLASYPGSPEWARRQLRDQDSLTLFELHPGEGQALESWAGHGKARVIREDGLTGLVRRLPPPQPRLLVLLDPSWEVKSDYQQVPEVLEKAWRKCRHGVFIIWYPILAGEPHQRLLEKIRTGPVRKVLSSELMLDLAPARGMAGSGLLIVNPPWGFAERFQEMHAEAGAALEASLSQSWLVAE